MCYAYQQLNDIGMLMPLPREGAETNPPSDIAKSTYQNITAEKLRLVQYLLRREQSFEKNDRQLSESIKVRYSSGFSQHR